ncbi:hypothetical protein LJC09_04690, partial [Desulfovibrio sp. OttesenSCG-928-F20]|nr:hypothetical protein [Desulfovibrio sp. OttesenSCG-928-F20]
MRTFFLVWAVLLGLFAAPAEARLLTADLVREPQSLLPYCSWLPDPEGAHSVESISSGSLQERFAPLGDDALLK